MTARGAQERTPVRFVMQYVTVSLYGEREKTVFEKKTPDEKGCNSKKSAFFVGKAEKQNRRRTVASGSDA